MEEGARQDPVYPNRNFQLLIIKNFPFFILVYTEEEIDSTSYLLYRHENFKIIHFYLVKIMIYEYSPLPSINALASFVHEYD